MIPVIRGANLYGMHDAERCCFCLVHTRFMTHLLDRPPREQVPCCEPCARTHAKAQVPGRQAYLDLAHAREEAHWRHGGLEVR